MIETSFIGNNTTKAFNVFKFSNFVSEKYLATLKNKTKQITIKDIGQKKSNVKATKSDWKECLRHKEFQELGHQIIQFTDICMKFTSDSNPCEYSLVEMWGMRHQKGEYTQEHNHFPSFFSGVFYVDVPGETILRFPSYNHSEIVKANTLYLFNSFIRHSSPPQTYDGDRLSISFNIIINYV